MTGDPNSVSVPVLSCRSKKALKLLESGKMISFIPTDLVLGLLKVLYPHPSSPSDIPHLVAHMVTLLIPTCCFQVSHARPVMTISLACLFSFISYFSPPWVLFSIITAIRSSFRSWAAMSARTATLALNAFSFTCPLKTNNNNPCHSLNLS